MTEQQLAEIEQRWAKATKDLTLHLPDTVSSIAHTDTGMAVRMSVARFYPEKAQDFEGRTAKLITGTQAGNAEAFASAPTDIALLLAEVRRLQEKLQYEETCHAEAQEEVRRLNRMVDKACGLLEMSEDSHMDDIGWRKYLKSEVADK